MIRLFFRPHRHLRFKLAMAQPDGMHPELLAGPDFARRAVADNEDLAGHQPRALLDLAESGFLGQHIAPVGVIDLFDRWLTVQPEDFYFCVLDLRFAEADNEISDAAPGQETQQRQ